MEYQTYIEGFTLKDADRTECGEILKLIQGIAKYEAMEDQVTATIESLEESIFNKQRAHVLLARENNLVIGYMLYFFNYSTFTGSANLYLEDLFLYEPYRHKGYGKVMFQTLAEIALREKAQRIDWVCLDWNTPSLEFYKKIGAKALNYWIVHRLEGEAISQLAATKKKV